MKSFAAAFAALLSLPLAATGVSAISVTYGCTSVLGDVRTVSFDPLGGELPIEEHPDGGSIVIVPVAPSLDLTRWTVIYNVVCEALGKVTECLEAAQPAAATKASDPWVSAALVQERFTTCLLDGPVLCLGIGVVDGPCMRPDAPEVLTVPSVPLDPVAPAL